MLFCAFAYNSVPLSAQNNTNPTSHLHDFDFWIGHWDVYKYGTDTLVGLSEISSIVNHRSIQEKYKSSRGPYRGTSTNIYNKAKDRWEQYWVDNSGLVLHITGGLQDGKMILKNCENNSCNKIIWTPEENKQVRQEWFQSNDNGITWKKVFDGQYRAKSSTDKVMPALVHLNKYPNVRDFTISQDGNEAYITVQNPTEERRTICRLNRTNGVWSSPIPASFSGIHKDIEPYFSPNNLRLYFASNRPNKFEKENYDIYYVERIHKDSTWSEPINVGLPVNTASNEFYPAITISGNLYFTCVKPHNKGKDDIYFSQWTNGSYSEPLALDSTINTPGYEFNSFVAPDESYLIFSGYNRSDGLGSGDMYISFRSQNGTWTEAKNIGKKINSKYMDYCPFVDQKNQVLYFTSRRNAEQKEEIRSLSDLENSVLRYQNGSSKIYKVKMDVKDEK